jgi:hypothetical protein
VNWLRGFAPVEHSAPPRKDMMKTLQGRRCVEVRTEKEGNEKAIVQGESQMQARVKWLAAIDQQVGVKPDLGFWWGERGSPAPPLVLGQRPWNYTLAREARVHRSNIYGSFECKLNIINFVASQPSNHV